MLTASSQIVCTLLLTYGMEQLSFSTHCRAASLSEKMAILLSWMRRSTVTTLWASCAPNCNAVNSSWGKEWYFRDATFIFDISNLEWCSVTTWETTPYALVEASQNITRWLKVSSKQVVRGTWMEFSWHKSSASVVQMLVISDGKGSFQFIVSFQALCKNLSPNDNRSTESKFVKNLANTR